jgi:hypothetical protein
MLFPPFIQITACSPCQSLTSSTHTCGQSILFALSKQLYRELQQLPAAHSTGTTLAGITVGSGSQLKTNEIFEQ